MFDFLRKKVLIGTINQTLSVTNKFFGEPIGSYEKNITIYLFKQGSRLSYKMRFHGYSDINEEFFKKAEKNFRNPVLEKWVETGDMNYLHLIKGLVLLGNKQ